MKRATSPAYWGRAGVSTGVIDVTGAEVGAGDEDGTGAVGGSGLPSMIAR